jgi:hypothetical protein
LAGGAGRSALAAVVDQRAVAETYIAVFAGFALLLFVLVLALVGVASGRERRAARVRNAAVGFVALAVAAAAVLGALREARRYASIESGFLWCAGILVAAAVVFVVHAFVTARKRGG